MKQTISFTKMQALGNDFVILNNLSQQLSLTPARIQQWANRHLGIGFDQLLCLEKSNLSEVDFFCDIFNADGSSVGQCGNGIRCLARFVIDKKLTDKKNIIFQTKTTRMQAQLEADNTISVNIGKPLFMPPFPLTLENETYQLHVVNVGNPHVVLHVSDVATAPVEMVGHQLSKHVLFPEGINVGFMEIQTPEKIKLRVYERGVGETLACGSGACAAAAVSMTYYHGATIITVDLPGGSLQVAQMETRTLVLRGEAVFVFEGQLSMND